jgi:hydrogenase-4 component F
VQILGLILAPLIAGLATFKLSSRIGRRALLVSTALLHVVLTASLWLREDGRFLNEWLAVDAAGLLMLTIVSGLFFASAVYSLGYLKREETAGHKDYEEGFLFSNEPEAVFIGCLLLFLSSMTLVTASQHLGLLWVGVEATTLASAPLIYFHRHHRSLEATWKYLLICSVGIALALLGNFLLAVSASGHSSSATQLTVASLVGKAGTLHVAWLEAAFLFFLVGYGTKMGLAPMHTWLPDAHSESPSAVSALLSGALLNCAFLGIFRCHQVCVAAGVGDFSGSLLVVFGLISMAVAAAFIVRQADFKRMLAYSSVEHMGVLAVGVGLGGAGVFGSLLHAYNHSFTKAALFLTAGNILAVFGTKRAGDVRGVSRLLPVTGAVWVAGFLSITGSPPFGTFLSEFTILKAALDSDRVVVAVLYLLFLAVIFVGMSNIVLRMSQGIPERDGKSSRVRPSLPMVAAPVVLLAVALGLGFHVPSQMTHEMKTVQQSLMRTNVPDSVSASRRRIAAPPAGGLTEARR